VKVCCPRLKFDEPCRDWELSGATSCHQNKTINEINFRNMPYRNGIELNGFNEITSGRSVVRPGPMFYDVLSHSFPLLFSPFPVD